MIALIDIGNTTTEIKIWNPEDNSYLNNYLLFTDNLIKNKENIIISEQVSEVIYSSVVPGMNEIIEKTFSNVKVTNIKTSDKLKQSDFLIDKNILGSDLITNFYALKSEKDFIVVTLGTATTFCVVQDEIFKTRIISPGLNTSLEGLADKVKGFVIDPKMEWKNISNLDGLSTIDALNFGTFFGHIKMIEGVVDHLKSEYKIKKVFITGGLIGKIKNLQNQEWTISQDLIFEGLKHFI